MPAEPTPGRLIVIEGLDGVGKSTLVRSLCAALAARADSTPGPALRGVRPALEEELSASRVARSLCYGSTVIAAGARAVEQRATGADVVMDRYWLSTWVHAPVEAHPALRALAPLVPAPTCTLYLRLGLAARRARLAARGLTDEDARTLLEHEALEAAYLALRAHPAAGRFVEIDAGQPPLAVLADCVGVIEALGAGAADPGAAAGVRRAG